MLLAVKLAVIVSLAPVNQGFARYLLRRGARRRPAAEPARVT